MPAAIEADSIDLHGDTPLKNVFKRHRLLTALVPVAVLIGCVPVSQYNSLDAQYQQLSQSLGSEISSNEVTISKMAGAIKVTVNSQLLFPSGGWQMSAQAQQTIAKIAPILAPVQKNRVLVNGYTDNTPIGPELAAQGVTTNMILSQKRADNVMQFLVANGVNPALPTAQGFGDANPVASNDTAAGRAQNRRVELQIAAAGT